MLYALYNGIIVTLHIFYRLQDFKKLDKGCSLHSRTPCPYADAITYTLLRCSHQELPAAPRHVRITSACFPKPSEDAPLLAFFPITSVQCLRSDSCHY